MNLEIAIKDACKLYQKVKNLWNFETCNVWGEKSSDQKLEDNSEEYD